MFIETWIAAMLIAFVFVGALISTIGWMLTDRRNEEERKLNKEIVRLNSKLASENEQLRAKLSLIKLRIDMEEKM